jgi:WD40 repeat protein/DNA-binding SARP family transcriptional activator
MEFRLLGPLEALDGGNPIPLGGPKQRTVLAHLLLRPEHLVPADRLIDEVWGEEPPTTARNALQTYVSHLRKALGRDRLEGRSRGYVLHVEPSEVDAFRFEALVERGRRLAPTDAAAAVRLYGEALALWRAPALDDLADQPSLRPEITRLEELRMAATEERVDAELDLGRHAELIPELETLTARNPLRERLWGDLMTALYRSGRQGNALAAFQRGREVLAEELGIDPSRELQRLHEQILRQDPALEVGGEPLRGYRLLDQVGEGAFGAVHRAFQPQVGREVAVKVIHPRLANNPEFIRRFEAEAQLVARLEHPHVVPLYDYWREPDGAYLVMRFLRGGSLRDALREGPLAPETAVGVLDHVAQALASAHRQGVVHRDIKPANILFDEEWNAYLSDFGIAKELAAAPGSIRGRTPSPFAYYTSPEEVRGETPSSRADIYSLGLVLYEMLAGRHPYAGSPPQALAEKHLREPVPSLRSARADIPSSVAGIIERATAKDPEERFTDARALASALRAAIGTASALVSVPAVEVRNPYKGLRPFLEADAADFFGREDLVDRLVARMTEGGEGSRLLAVVGPSGSGKSSLVRAGLVPALRRGAVQGSEDWFVAQMMPGGDPFAELEGALLRVAATPLPPDLLDPLERDRDGLLRAAAWVLPNDGSELLLVIDQFEELFTLVDDEDTRARFLASVAAAATVPRSRVRFVINIRADFYDRPLLYRTLAELVRARTEVVIPLSAGELERAVTSPADRVGVAFAPGLVAQLVADVADQPGALPLLQYALTELFDRRQDSTLAAATYREIGGVTGALARRAEEVFASLSDGTKQAARQLFLRLVTPGEGTEDTRRRVLQAELTSLDTSPAEMEAAIVAFGEARLLSFDRDVETRGPTVEVAHEALLREWGRLRGLIDAAREDLRTERRLVAAVRDWAEAGRDASFLASGSRLEQLEAWQERSSLAITPEEREYLEASLAERDRRRAEEGARQARERALERRSWRRLWALVAVLAAAALIASGLTVFAFNQRGRAEREGRVAIARELAAAAVANLEVDPERSILLALEAVDRTRSVDGSVLPEAEEALHRAVLASRIVLSVPGLGGALDWSPDGTMFVTEGPEESGMVDIRDARTGESLRSFHGHDVDVNDVAFSADGSMLATTGDDGAARVWDPMTGQEVWSFEREDGGVWGPSFSPDGSLLGASWPDQGMVRLFDLAAGRTVREIGPLPVTWETSFSPDGERLAVAVADPPGAIVVDVRSGQEAFALRGHGFPVQDVDWSPDGRWIATSSQDSTARIWEAKTGDPRYTLFGHTAAIVGAEWSPDSTRLVTGSGDGTAKVWEINENGAREAISLSAQDMASGVLAVFSPDGTRVMTGDAQIRSVKVWDVSRTGDAEWANLPADPADLGGVAFTPDGRRVIASNGDGSVTGWDAETGQRSLTIGRPGPSGGPPGAILAIDVSPDGRLIATAGPTGKVWEAGTGEEAFSISPGGGVEDVAWSPDGALLAAGSFGGQVKIVDRSGREVAVLRDDPGFRVSALRFSPDGRLLATAGDPTERVDPTVAAVTIWDWEQGRVVRRIRAWAEGLSFDPTGARIATAGVFGRAEIWDVESGRKVATLAGHTGAVNDVAFGPDGSVIASASTDGTVRLWEPESGVEILALRGHETPVWDLAFSPDGSKLASASPDGSVRVWALGLDDLIEIARRELTRAFTDEECRQYLHLARCPRD